jgi:Mn2+/Fe2+ NRAMP family transporter
MAAGPGLVFFLAVVGPQDLVSNSAVGASYGYSTLWVLVLIVAARFVILESSARYVLVTGESILTGYRRVGRWVVWLIFVSLLLKRHLANLFQILLLGSFAHLLVPLPTRWSGAIWALVFWTLGFVLMYWGRYQIVERLSKPLIVLLGGAMVTVALLSQPDPAAIATGLLIPSIPPDQGVYSYLFLVMALAGSSAGSVGNLKYATFVHEKGWRDLSFLKRQRSDLLVSVIAIFAMGALMQIAAAAVLRPLGVQLQNVEDLVPLFSSALGQAGRIILGVGILAAVFNTYLGTNTGYSLMVSDIYHSFIRPSKEPGPSTGTSGSHAHRPAYRWCLIWFCVSPLYVLLTDWKPIWLTLFTASLFVVLLPVVVLVLLRLTTDRRLMGCHVNGWATNAVLLFVAVMAACLTYRNAVEFWAKNLSGFFK